MKDAHARDGLDVCHYFNVNASEGLSDEQVLQQQPEDIFLLQVRTMLLP
jgi:hypothetical protein